VRVKVESLESVRKRLMASVSDEAIAALERLVDAYERGVLPPRPRKKLPIPRRTVLAFTDKTHRDQNGCLLWTASLTERGHGRFSVNGEVVRAHRFAWELAHGPIPEGFRVRQTCGVKSCVEVAHLELIKCRKPVDRFWEKTKLDPANGCLLWTAATTRKGYGVFGSRPQRAHHYAWELAHGPIPEGMVLHHTCGVPACVNVEHLEPMEKGEHSRLRGRRD
jgi:hypothetical protein